MEREKVYYAIDTEREYQTNMTKKEDRPDMIEDLHIGDALTAIQVNLDKAKGEWYKGSVPHQDTMEYLRKVAGLIVQAGEKYGIPNRKI